MKFEENVTVLCGFMFLCYNAYICTTGYKERFETGLILSSVVMAFVLQHRVQIGQASVFRSADSGLWCCFMLPSVANGVEIEDKVLLWALVLVTLLSYVCYQEWCVSRSWCLFAGIVYVCLTCQLTYNQPLDAVFIGGCCLGYMYLLFNVPSWFPKSFTFGEVSIVLQLYICQTYRMIRTALSKSSTDAVGKSAVVVYFGVHVAVLYVYVLSSRPARLLWPGLVLLGLGYILAALMLYLDVTDIEGIFHNVIFTSTSVVILSWWSVWLISSVMMVCYHGNRTSEKPRHKSARNSCQSENENMLTYDKVNVECSQNETDTEDNVKQIVAPRGGLTYPEKHKQWNKQNIKHCVGDVSSVRKYFHLAMVCVYVPGLLVCPDLLYLASILTTALLLILEMFRVLNIQPIGPILNQYLTVFLDDQDKGDLILTPIYLLLGCSIPLWWNYKQQKPPCSLSMYAGLISVGVGDSMASIVGRTCGRHKWPDSKKSVEGSCAAIVTQIVSIYCLQQNKIPGAVVSVETTLCVILISLLEAFTLQIDNLVIPLFAWILFTAVEPTY